MRQAPLSGRYELEEIIGTGGMAVVYRAWDLKYDREVAVKVLRSEFTEDEDFIHRFNNEAQAVSKMSHPNIVDMYDVGQDGDTRYIVMEYVHGITLKDMIRQNGQLTPRTAVSITLRILAAMEHAHKIHIIHRDIKPANILMDRDGNIKVADFGIARTVNSTTNNGLDGHVFGSVHYLSPEQALGKATDARSDLYSVGVALYEMVTGQVPFNGDTPIGVVMKKMQEQPIPPSQMNPSVSKGLDEVILKAMKADKDQRYASASEFATDLRRAMKMPEGGFIRKQPQKPHKKNIALRRIALCAGIALTLTVGALLSWRFYERLQTRVRVPNMLQASVEDAIAQLEEANLAYDIEEVYHDDVIAGMVVSQWPNSDNLIYPDGVVHLTVSKGREFVNVPDVTGLSRSEAIAKLEESDLTGGETILILAQEKPGIVVRQEPSAGEDISPFSEVTLYVSGESAEVPLLNGLTVELARSILAASGFALGEVVEQPDDIVAGTVIAQSLAAGTEALLGETVSITISTPLHDGFSAEADVYLNAQSDDDEVVARLTTPSGETRVVYRAPIGAGMQKLTLHLTSDEEGEHILSVFVNDGLIVDKRVVFSEG